MTDDPDRSPPAGLQSGFLLGALILVIVSAFVRSEPGTAWSILSAVFYVVVFSVAGYLIGARRRWLAAYAAVAGPTLIAGILAASLTEPHPAFRIAGDSLGLVLQILMVVLVFRFSLFQRSASRLDRLIAGICGYLILGLMWANLYSLLEILLPGGLADGSGGPVDGAGGDFVYFSLITLSSTGYGDILAKTPVTRLLACVEAISGTLYLAVFISTLIGGGGEATEQKTD